MKFRKARLLLSRTKLKERSFYEDVAFETKEVKKHVQKIVEEWMSNLKKEKQIEIEKFKDLFVQLKEVAFPIKIKGVRNSRFGSFDIEILDDEGKEYYMSKRNYHENICVYIIGRRNSLLEPLIDRDFHYELHQNGKIALLETGAMRLKADGTNDNLVVDFSFDFQNHITEATLKSFASNNQIKMQYPTMTSGYDQKVMNFLFDMNDKHWYYYDVLPILKWMLLTISDEKLSLSITAEVEKEVCSEIEIVNGIVVKYMQTQIINEGEIRLSKIILAKKLKEFLVERS